MWEQILKYDTNQQMFIALFVIFVTLFVLYFSYKSRKSRKSVVLLTGLCESGKTLLFSQLVYGRNSQTYTSMKENYAEFKIEDKKLRIVDIPGHERLRSKYLDTYEPLTRGVVFVIDSTTVKKDIRDAAEYLCSIYLRLMSNNIKHLLILCNKQVEKGALDVENVKKLLEKEINTVSYTKSKQLEDVSSEGKKTRELEELRDFSFSSSSVKTDFITCTSVDELGKINLDELKLWMTEIA